MTLAEAIVGRTVIYTPYEGCPPTQLERGVITSVGTKFVFVRYGSNLHSQATCAEDLKYES